MKKRILMVDDEQEVLASVVGELERWGYEVLTAADGEAALQLAREKTPDLILMDVLMPKLNGYDVCARLKTHPATQDIPVVLLTALGMSTDVQMGKNLGVKDYLVKPFKMEELKVCISSYIGH